MPWQQNPLRRCSTSCGTSCLKWRSSAPPQVSSSSVHCAFALSIVSQDYTCQWPAAFGQAAAYKSAMHTFSCHCPSTVQVILVLLMRLRASWASLLSVLTAGSVLHLLTVVFGSSANRAAASLEELMPRLWPLFRHPLTRVRLAAVHCLQAFLTHAAHSQPWLTTTVLQTALRYMLWPASPTEVPLCHCIVAYAQHAMHWQF